MLTKFSIQGALPIVVLALTLVVSVVNFGHQFEPAVTRNTLLPSASTSILARVDEVPTHTYDRIPIASERAIGYIDSVRVTARSIIVRGWIVTPNRTLAQQVIVLIDDSPRFEITSGSGVPRPDVAVYLNQADLGASGIFTTLLKKSISKGVHRLRLAAFIPENNAIYTVEHTIEFKIE